MKKKNILFICSSNVCRSPYAEMQFDRLVQSSEILRDKVEVHSAGVLNKSKAIHPKTASALVADGFDLDKVLQHIPTNKRSDLERFERADIIVSMSKMHKALTPKKFRDKVITLSELATGSYSKIPDPFLIADQEKYNKVMNIIKIWVEAYFDVLESEMR